MSLFSFFTSIIKTQYLFTQFIYKDDIQQQLSASSTDNILHVSISSALLSTSCKLTLNSTTNSELKSWQ